MDGTAAFLLSILMIAAFLLVAGGLFLIFRRAEPRKGVLMLAAGAVLIGNVAILTL